MLKENIKQAYAKVQSDRQNAADWLAIAKTDMKVVDTLCRAMKNIDPAFDKKAYLAELDEQGIKVPEPQTDPDEYLKHDAEEPANMTADPAN